MAPDFSSVTTAAPANVLEDIAGLIITLRTTRKEIEDQTSRLENLNGQFNQLVLVTIPEAMQQAGLSEFKTTNGAVLKVKDDINAHINQANQPSAYTWLRGNGLGSIIKSDLIIDTRVMVEDDMHTILDTLKARDIEPTWKESIHAAALKATVKELLAKGATLPAEISVHQFKKAELKEPKV